jgi:hypothetical protein
MSEEKMVCCESLVSEGWKNCANGNVQAPVRLDTSHSGLAIVSQHDHILFFSQIILHCHSPTPADASRVGLVKDALSLIRLGQKHMNCNPLS